MAALLELDGYFKTSDGIQIHYRSAGRAGSWVVLIHGYNSSCERWFQNGLAPALAQRHRVVAIDCRNHGKSDKPEPRGPGLARDVIELLDHLGIERAHFHGYSMGGGITARLMGEIAPRMITASFGGSGVRETDPELDRRAAALDVRGSDPQEGEARRALAIRSALDNGLSQEEAERRADAAAAQPAAAPATAAAPTAAARQSPPPIDLTQIRFPVIAIIGEYDSPHARTARMSRELRDFRLHVLPGKSHLTAISAPYMPPQYTEALTSFVDANDSK